MRLRPAFPIPAALAAALVAAAPTASAQLSPRELTIAGAVDRRAPSAIALLERLVNINSGTMNFAGVRAVGDVLREKLDSLGFTTRWVDGAAFGRAGHLVAEHPGPGPKLLLIGHLDTVFEPSSPFQRFELRADSMAGGPGIIDMKGGDVIILAALQALREAGGLAGMNVTVVFDGDEESAGEPVAAARKALVDAAQGAVAAIGFEDGPGDPKLGVISRRGATQWKLTATGLAGHASQIFRTDLGAGAVNEAARILGEFYQKLAGEPYLAFSAGLILGGSDVTLDSTLTSGSARGKTNVIAQRVVVTGDIRTISPEQLTRTMAAMREIVSRHLPHTDATIEFLEGGYPPLAPTDGNRRLLSLFDQTSRDLKLGPVEPVDPTRAGAADVAFIAGIVPMIIDGVGLSGHDDHSDKETADLRMLSVQAKRAAVLLHRLTTRPELVAPVRP
ncbi:MAG: M20/M25/M40 family metallo-hydrolase [Gemmatimonadota bacterium]|nr:M20/M25/M40 family metallo-hydrolase [Gemmatimonadota bacterium]